MARRLEPPSHLSDQTYFVVRYDRELEVFELCLPRTDQTYSLGDAAQTRDYFKRIGLEHLGGRALDAAHSFGASQALMREGRAFGLDLTDPRIDKNGARRDLLHDHERLLGADEDEVLVI